MDGMEQKRVALIPAYEPDGALTELVVRLWSADYEVVVVDDGSGPGYAEVFAQARPYAAVLTHRENRGKGAALKTGLAYIGRHFGNGGIVVTADADGQHCFEDVEKLCQAASRRPDALVLGCRALGKSAPLRSRFGNALTRQVCHAFTGRRIQDTQTGLRAFGMGLIPMFLSVPGERYEYEMNVLLACTRQGVPILEEEIRAIYVNGNAASHFDVLRDSCRIYKEILKFMLSSFLGFLIDYTAYALLLFFTSDLWFSNIAARIVSASANYAVNRRFVFGSRGGAVKPAMQYAALAALILAANTLLLGYLAESCGISRMLAKIVTELICFTVSWTVQKAVIFRKDVRRQP